MSEPVGAGSGLGVCLEDEAGTERRSPQRDGAQRGSWGCRGALCTGPFLQFASQGAGEGGWDLRGAVQPGGTAMGW